MAILTQLIRLVKPPPIYVKPVNPVSCNFLEIIERLGIFHIAGSSFFSTVAQNRSGINRESGWRRLTHTSMMAEDSVKKNIQPAVMCLLNKFPQVVFGAEMRIYAEIIICKITGGLKLLILLRSTILPESE